MIGFGGGAALDVAKVVGVMATHAGDVLEYVWDHPQVRPITNELPYFVALPTTSGTGSEVGRSSVVSENDTHHKRTVFSAKILAKAVFADPELTLALPGPVTAATGMDALTHNIESYLSPAYHPLCDGIALEGLRIGARALATAVREPGNLQARGRHDDELDDGRDRVPERPRLGARLRARSAPSCDLHHGLANALMIDTVLDWNREAVPDKFAELSHAAGIEPGSDGAAFIRWLRALKARIGITGGLAARGVTRSPSAAVGAIGREGFHRADQPAAHRRGGLRTFLPRRNVRSLNERPLKIGGLGVLLPRRCRRAPIVHRQDAAIHRAVGGALGGRQR